MSNHIDIIQSGDPVLRKKAKEVNLKELNTPEFKALCKKMLIALDAEPDGVAIAAPQIGVSLRVFIVSHRAFELELLEEHHEGDLSQVEQKENMIVINPEIVKLSRKKVSVPEGCLSVRWFYGNTMRHEKATIRAYDENGKPFTYGGAGLIAQVFQHETDHLNGTLFIDHATEIEELSADEIKEVKERAKKFHQK